VLRLFWHCLDPRKGDEEFVASAFQELADLLRKPPVEAEFQATPLTGQVAETVAEEFKGPRDEMGSPLPGYFDAVESRIRERSLWVPLLVYCSVTSEIAKVCRRAHPSHLWGSAWYPFVSVVYRPNNKYLLWHEALHLFHAHDCYSEDAPNGPTTCELPDCIMQYAPSEETVGEWPFLCQKNTEAIRRCAEEPPPRTV